MRKIFEKKDADAVLLVDAANAFKRKVPLYNIGILCPAIARYV